MHCLLSFVDSFIITLFEQQMGLNKLSTIRVIVKNKNTRYRSSWVKKVKDKIIVILIVSKLSLRCAIDMSKLVIYYSTNRIIFANIEHSPQAKLATSWVALIIKIKFSVSTNLY